MTKRSTVKLMKIDRVWACTEPWICCLELSKNKAKQNKIWAVSLIYIFCKWHILNKTHTKRFQMSLPDAQLMKIQRQKLGFNVQLKVRKTNQSAMVPTSTSVWNGYTASRTLRIRLRLTTVSSCPMFLSSLGIKDMCHYHLFSVAR